MLSIYFVLIYNSILALLFSHFQNSQKIVSLKKEKLTWMCIWADRRLLQLLFLLTPLSTKASQIKEDWYLSIRQRVYAQTLYQFNQAEHGCLLKAKCYIKACLQNLLSSLKVFLFCTKDKSHPEHRYQKHLNEALFIRFLMNLNSVTYRLF